MFSHPRSTEPPTSGPRTGQSWSPWRAAWIEAAYGVDGFWSTQQPGAHFSTAVGVGPLVAQAVAGLVPDGGRVVVDVGAGDGRLLAHLVDLLPGVTLVGVDRRPRPPRLDPRVRWAEDHWDVETETWTAGGPDAWTDEPRPLLVAHEWLDDLPVVVVRRASGGWHEVEVDPTGQERLGPAVDPDDHAWLTRWWGDSRRAEVGRSRDAAWGGLVRAAVERGGRALAVDYGHVGQRPVDGTFTAYGRGRQRSPVPDGSVNLTAAIAVDALAVAGEAAGATTLLLRQQAEVLASVPDAAGDPLEALVRRSERAALTDPARWGDVWWLLQGSGPAARLA